METIPLSARKLDIDFEAYESISENIRRMSAISLRTRLEILKRAERELPTKTIICLLKLAEDMADDRLVYRIAGLDYAKGPPVGKKLFMTAVVDYYLSKRFFI